MAALGCGLVAAITWEQPPTPDAARRDRIDDFVERERQASGIPGIALAIVQLGSPAHVRGFGDDGRGTAISADTPFPVGSVTKSFTALLVRQAIDAGQLDVDAPVQRYLPWFRVADSEAPARITVRHMLNQTSGFSRANGIAPLLQGSTASIEDLARGLGAVSLNRPVGERYEYSNLNFVLLGAVLQAVTGRSWQELIQTEVLQPLQMHHSHTDHDAAQKAGMTALHRMWFGVPVAHSFVSTGKTMPVQGPRSKPQAPQGRRQAVRIGFPSCRKNWLDVDPLGNVNDLVRVQYLLLTLAQEEDLIDQPGGQGRLVIFALTKDMPVHLHASHKEGDVSLAHAHSVDVEAPAADLLRGCRRLKAPCGQHFGKRTDHQA
jgi:CubicO group peptidase (beta-lactamase class C family)